MQSQTFIGGLNLQFMNPRPIVCVYLLLLNLQFMNPRPIVCVYLLLLTSAVTNLYWWFKSAVYEPAYRLCLPAPLN